MTDLTLDKTLCPLPDVQRGYGYQMYANGKKGDRIVYCNGKSVFLRSLEDPSVGSIFAGEHKEKVNVANFSPNGEWVASGDAGGRLIVWGQGNFSIKGDYPINKTINDVVWDPDGKRICAAGTGSQAPAKCISWDTGSALGSVVGHIKNIITCDYKPTRPYRIVTGAEDNAIILHEGPPFKLSKTIKEHTNYVNKVKFSPSGEVFVSVSSDKKINCFDGKTGDLLKTIGAEGNHTGSIYSFAWSPDSAKIMTCGADKLVKVWDYESGACETTFTMGSTVNDMQLCALWHKEYMLTVSLSGAINYLDAASPDAPKKVIMGHVGKVQTLAIDHANKVFYTADNAGVLCSWKDGIASWFAGAGHKKTISGIAVNSDGSKVVSVGYDDKLRFNDTATLAFGDDATPLGGCPTCVAAGSKNPGLAAAGLAQDKVVVVLDGTAATTAVPDKPTSLKFSPDDSKLAVGFNKAGVKVYTVSGTELKLAYEIKDLNKKVGSVEWSPDGAFLLTAGDNKRILAYKDGETENLNPTDWEFHNGGVSNAAFSPDGTKCVSVGSDLSIFVFIDTVKWSSKRKKQLMCHREGITACGFLDNDTVVSVGADSSIKIWKI